MKIQLYPIAVAAMARSDGSQRRAEDAAADFPWLAERPDGAPISTPSAGSL